MDKTIFLLDKERYATNEVSNLTERDLEKWVAEETYNDDYTIIKIDANGYESVEIAINEELPFINLNDYYIFSFGF